MAEDGTIPKSGFVVWRHSRTGGYHRLLERRGYSSGAFYLICLLIRFPMRAADKEWIHAVTMATGTRRGRTLKVLHSV